MRLPGTRAHDPYRGRAHETVTARRWDGRRQPASGALKGKKGDIKTRAFLIEAKATKKDSFRIMKTTWDKIQIEAGQVCRTPVLVLNLNGRRLVIINEDDFLCLMTPEE